MIRQFSSADPCKYLQNQNKKDMYKTFAKKRKKKKEKISPHSLTMMNTVNKESSFC